MRGIEVLSGPRGRHIAVLRLETGGILPAAFTLRRRSSQELIQRIYASDITAVEKEGPRGVFIKGESSDLPMRLGLVSEYAARRVAAIVAKLAEEVGPVREFPAYPIADDDPIDKTPG